MKGILLLELFGENTRQQFKIYRRLFELGGGDFGRMYFDKYLGGIPPRSSWVAEITGPDEKYGLNRKFLNPKMDYSRSNSVGSRGIIAEYILSEGKIYEVKSQVSWKHADRYFCTVSPEGDIIEIEEYMACHAVGALTKEERRSLFNAKRISRNQCSGSSEAEDQ